MSLYDPALLYWYGLKAWANFGLKKYDQAIDWPAGRSRSIQITSRSCTSFLSRRSP